MSNFLKNAGETQRCGFFRWTCSSKETQGCIRISERTDGRSTQGRYGKSHFHGQIFLLFPFFFGVFDSLFVIFKSSQNLTK